MVKNQDLVLELDDDFNDDKLHLVNNYQSLDDSKVIRIKLFYAFIAC